MKKNQQMQIQTINLLFCIWKETCWYTYIASDWQWAFYKWQGEVSNTMSVRNKYLKIHRPG